MSKQEVELRYRNQRIKRYQQKGHCVDFVAIHALFNRILLPLMVWNRKSQGYKVEIIKDLRTSSKRRIIYCPTHIGGIDIQIAAELAKRPCFIMIGDPRDLYKSFEGLLLKLNGWIPFDTLDKVDRKIAAANMEEILRRRGNVLMFPEGTQNANPSILLNHLYVGAVKAAINCGAEIVPIAMERVGKNYYCAIGKNISYENSSMQEAVYLTDLLRDEMATLKWEIFEYLPISKRSEVSTKDFQEYVNQILDVGTDYTMTLDEVRAAEFHPKDEIQPKDVFQFMEHLSPNIRNAFLLRGNHMIKN